LNFLDRRFDTQVTKVTHTLKNGGYDPPLEKANLWMLISIHLQTFAELPINKTLKKVLAASNFTTLKLIQSQVISHLLLGHLLLI
jgi:hypothetical protein